MDTPFPQQQPRSDPGPVIIIPCFNRKAITLECLSRLKETLASPSFRVLVVDDASTDGTAEAIAQDFPEVEVLHGKGELYWTGAIELGMRHAISQGASCCLWLNDDLTVVDGSIEQIIKIALQEEAIVTGQGIIDLSNGDKWYFPLLFRGRHGLIARDFDPNETRAISVDTCRGNMVAIPKAVVTKIGYPDGVNIPHMAGDSDYGLRATSAGFRCLTLPKAIFYELETIRTDNRSWLLGNKTALEILKAATSKRGVLYPRMVFVYQIRHWGFRGGATIIKDFVHLILIMLLKLTIPKHIRHKLFAASSHAYQTYQHETHKPPA